MGNQPLGGGRGVREWMRGNMVAVGVADDRAWPRLARIALHPSLFGVTEVYRELGCEFPAYQSLAQPDGKPTVVITPPSARRNGLKALVGEFKTAALTGWAMDRSLKDRLEVDAVFPLSDHADFEELCCYAEQVDAAMTYTVLGFDEELAMHLRRRGLRAKALTDVDQLRLF